MSGYDELSRLLDGDLPPDQAAALRERIAREPQLRADWEAMQALPHLLRHLPEERPPAHLDAIVLGAASTPAAPPWRRWAMGGALAMAAVAAAWLVMPREPAVMLLAQGDQLVEGDVRVLAGDRSVDVDGRVLVHVEPPAAWSGVADSVPLTAQALAGSAVTVTVYEGVAIVHTAGGQPYTVSAGQTHTLGTPAQMGGSSGNPRLVSSDPAMQLRIAQLEGELEKLRFEQKVSRGRLAMLEGEPIEWPADAPPGARPADFERALRETLAADPRYELLELDCEEFPCLATVRMDKAGADGEQVAQAMVRSLNNHQFGGDAHAIQSFSRVSDEPESAVYLGFGLIPDGWEKTGMEARLGYRMDGMLSAVEPGLGEEP